MQKGPEGRGLPRALCYLQKGSQHKVKNHNEVNNNNNNEGEGGRSGGNALNSFICGGKFKWHDAHIQRHTHTHNYSLNGCRHMRTEVLCTKFKFKEKMPKRRCLFI